MVYLNDISVPTEPNQPKYEWVKKTLLTYISVPENVTDFLPYEYEIEKELGVSKRTVRRALEDLRADGYIETVRNRGSKILRRDLPNSVTPSQGLLKGKTIGALIVSNTPEPGPTGYIPWVIAGEMEKLIQQEGGQLALYNLREKRWHDQQLVLESLEDLGVEWTFYYPAINTRPQELLPALKNSAVKTALYLQDFGDFNRLGPDMCEGIDWVVSNSTAGIYEFLKSYCTPESGIAYLACQEDLHWAQRRIDAIARYAKEQDIPFRLFLEKFDTPVDLQGNIDHPTSVRVEEYRYEGAYREAPKTMEFLSAFKNPLLIGANDVTTSGAMAYFHEHDISVPDQVAVIGYDNKDLCRQWNLSTFDLDAAKLAEAFLALCRNHFSTPSASFTTSNGKMVTPTCIHRMSTRNPQM